MEIPWVFKVVMTEVQERCTKRFVPIAKKSAKFLSSRKKIVQFIARIVFQSIRITVVK
jgi:hypothetical protein